MAIKSSMAIDFIRNFVQPGELVFDVGANIGQKADVYAAAGAKVICFEPQPNCVNILTEKYQNNQNIAIVNKGLAEQAGTMELSVCNDANYISTFSKKWQTGRFANYQWNETVSVEVTTLDEMIEVWGRPHFCKIDVEGFEYQVLKGLSTPIPYISFEFAIEFIDDTKKCINHLKTLGYKLFNFANGEQTNLVFPEWVSEERLVKYLESSNDSLLWGDIYAKFEANQHHISGGGKAKDSSNEVIATKGYLNLQKLCQEHSITPRGLIHIGAHEGQEMKEYQAMGVPKVLFIEANPSVFERLKQNIAGLPNVWAANCAVSNENGTVNLRVNSHDMSSSILPLKLHKDIYPGMVEVNQVTVISKTLDALLEQSPFTSADFNIINIDIQGAELLAFQGAVETLKYIDAIITEVNREELYEGCALIDQIDDFLSSYGFQRVAMANPSHPSWGDAFYVKKPLPSQDAGNFSSSGLSVNEINNTIIVTSIAPGNIENQRAAVESWRALGFSPVSLNTPEEISQLQPIYANVTFQAVNRDARVEAGRPLVYLDDMFAYLRDRPTKICGIVNSDIRLKAGDDFLALICKEAENSIVFGSRVDVETSENTEGKVYAQGFDFFFFDKQLLEQFPTSQFSLGLPWWDLWIPLTAHQKNLNLKYLASPVAYHIKHQVNYINNFWQTKGIHFTQFFDLNLSRQFEQLLANDNSRLQSELTNVAVQFMTLIDKQTPKIQYETKDVTAQVSDSLKVSAIVSTYNSENFIRGCLEDLINQTLYQKGALEIIVIDSNSQQNEGAVVREFQGKYPNIIYCRIPERETIYAAWNRGIQMSRGRYITNANADDRHRPDALEIMANYLESQPETALVYGDQLITNFVNDTWAATQSKTRWNWPEFSYGELEKRCITGSQPMWRKSLHEKHGYFRAELTAAGDYEFWLRIGKTENMCRIPEAIGLYYHNEQGLEYGSGRSQQETLKIWNEYGIIRRGVKPATTVPVAISPSQLNAMPYRTSEPALVSIIIPCYNHANLLREAVESVANQTYQNWECIIVNDGSTDDTSNFANYLIQLYPQKALRLIDKPNTGPADSRNVGVQQSSGKLILFLDADDKIHPKFIEECVEVLSAKPNVGFVYTDVQHFGANCDLVNHGDFEPNKFLRDNQAPATSLFRKEIYEQVGGLKKVMKLGCEDWEFWISAYEKGWLGYRLPQPYLYYRQHGDGSSRTQRMAGERPKLDLMRATIVRLHSQLYKPEEVRWSEQILQQHGNLIADELAQVIKPEQFLASLPQYLGDYQKDQTNQVALANIRDCRRQLADYLVNLPAEKLETAYSGDAGKAHQMLLNSTIKYEALTDAEQSLIAQLAAHISQGIKTLKDVNYLLAAALYRRADQLLLKYENAAIPNWFVNDYLKFMFAAPTLFQELGEADNYCHYVQGWVSYVHRNIFQNQNSQVWQEIAWFFTQSANFIPLYFNSENLKEIYRKRADIIEFAMKNRGAAIDCIFPARSANRQKIRVGVLTKHFGAMTETFATLPAFEYLNREQFEIILYAINLDGNKLEQYCQSRADRLVQLSNDLPTQVQTIRADDLDILLIATNITAVTHPISLLALHRLARVQTTCFNSPVTTGMRHIDYYIAGKLMEPTIEGRTHYREELVTVDGLGCCFSYTLEPYTPNVQLTRNSLGISEESVVFVSSANLYKLVPELRETWAKILAAVPNSLLFLMPFGPSWTNYYPGAAFVNNLQGVLAKYGVESQRLRVLKAFPNRADVKEVLKLGDVYLDSYPYAGTTSLVDPLEVGLPTVVRDGDTLRSRMGAAVVRSLLMPDLIAHDEASYIQLAVTLGTNPQLRQQKRQEIQQKMQANPPCFDSVAYSGAIAKLFQKLFSNWQSSHLEASHSLQASIPKQPDLSEILSNNVQLYQRNSSNISAISELRQIRKQIADFWLSIPAENLEATYKSAPGKSYQILLTSGFQHQAMMESEQIILQQLTQISKGLVHPKAVNALLAAMLYFPPGTMRIPDARNRLPHWLIGDYEQVFETESAVKSDSSSDLLAQYIQSPQFANQLLGCVNLYRIDSSDESVVLELRQIRKQLADFWQNVPSDKLETFYRGEVRKGYQAILSCGLQAESMTEAEQKFLQQLTETSKGLVHSQAINALLGGMLYFFPGKMRVPDARTRLPQWLIEDYEKVFESAFLATEQTIVNQDYLPQFLNQLNAAVNLYEIDPTAEMVIVDLRQIRKQIADLWLSLSAEQVELLYRSDFGKGYKAMLGSGFINEPLNESERAFFNSLVAELSKGFGTPKAVHNLLAAMLFCRAGQLQVQDANSCLPEWLFEDYEQFVGGPVKVAVG
ncbi:FkbM family methyltransferase [Lyngbya sp. CCAP 1446/10]|uniref:FkbM family methyltransferase n=1 Tax=Lyngbya sp. CCAP 1446/10 TaxID=439293 RepID=UPI0022373F28|nr:FkbM family methyltransferase [Lyngbya sp. CCAP 1446/10]MCW6052236.1 FkbM family methyltransferase [Lyngbya sp. CCAP 1446/10]